MAGFNSTLGGSASTSYISIAEADEFLTNSQYVKQWQGNTEAQKSQFLNEATFWLNQIDYAGTRCSPSTDNPNLPQALAWPRSGATCDGVEATCASIPAAIKNATAMLAAELSANPDAITGPIGGGGSGATAGTYVSKNQLGDLVQEFSAFPGGESSKNDCVGCDTPIVIEKFPWLKGLLGCWAIISTGESNRILLRVRS